MPDKKRGHAITQHRKQEKEQEKLQCPNRA